VNARIAGLLIGLLATSSAAPAGAKMREVMDDDVNRAIGAAKRYLIATQHKDGHWWRWHGRQVPHGGPTALATFALMEAGERATSEPVKKGLEWLVALKTNNLYVRAVRAMALGLAVAQVQDSPYHTPLKADVKWLTRKASSLGAWGYSGAERDGDNSCSQFALLALWEADRAGIPISPAVLRAVERTWLRRQRADGGWKYAGLASVESPSTHTMTSAGLASLYICQDVLTNRCAPYSRQKDLNEGWAFIEGLIKPDYTTNGYLAFCLQRIGLASGRKFIAGMDWFTVGAGRYAEPNPRGRSYRGKWGPIVQAAFELIFLARARMPLTFNKLQYGPDGSWNFHTRDVPRFTEYMRRRFEKRMRWQIVKITDDITTLLDAPIVLIAGNRAIDLTPHQWAKLREYTLRGGMMLMVPSHNSKAFLESAKQALTDLYADQRTVAGGYYELEQLAGNHPLYDTHRTIRNGHKLAPVWGVSDGSRLIAAVVRNDIACAWQRRRHARKRTDYSLGINLFFYAIGGNDMPMRLRPVFPPPRGEVRHRIKIARLRHAGNWFTQPYALEYLSKKLQAENRVAIDVTDGVGADLAKLQDHQLVWVTGTDKFTLSAAEAEALGKYIDGGGMIFFNAVTGSMEFRKSMLAAIEKVVGDRDLTEGIPSSSSPLMTGKCDEFRGPRIGKLARTMKFRRALKSGPPPLRVYISGDRIAVVEAPFGIHDTLDGHAAHGAMSYMPRSAQDLAANIVLTALAQARKRKPAPIPGPKTPTTKLAPKAAPAAAKK